MIVLFTFNLNKNFYVHWELWKQITQTDAFVYI